MLCLAARTVFFIDPWIMPCGYSVFLYQTLEILPTFLCLIAGLSLITFCMVIILKYRLVTQMEACDEQIDGLTE